MNIIEQIEADLRGGVIAVLQDLETRLVELELKLAPRTASQGPASAPGETGALPPT